MLKRKALHHRCFAFEHHIDDWAPLCGADEAIRSSASNTSDLWASVPVVDSLSDLRASVSVVSLLGRRLCVLSVDRRLAAMNHHVQTRINF